MTPGEVRLAQEWFLKRTGEALHIALTSQYGFMSYESETPIACVFLYPVSGSESCLLGLPIANPDVSKSTVSEGLDTAIKKAEAYAGHLGFRLMHMYAGYQAVVDRMIRLGFTLGDTNMIHVVKKVGK